MVAADAAGEFKTPPARRDEGFTPLRGYTSSAPFGGTCLPADPSRGRLDAAAGRRTRDPSSVSFADTFPQGECLGVRLQERKTPAVAEASGRVSLRAGERRHSPFD